MILFIIVNRNRKLQISRAPTKAKSQEPAYSQALNQNKIDRQQSRSRESGRQTVRRLWRMVPGVETGRGFGSATPRVRHSQGPPPPEAATPRVRRSQGPPLPGSTLPG